MSNLNQLQQYGIGFQIKVLSSLLKHKEFLQNINDILDTEMFDNPAPEAVGTILLAIKFKALTLLEKEKEQIIDAYNQGTLDGESSMIYYPNYFDQTYNQNK